MDVEEITRKYYGRLFLLPRWHSLLILYLLIVSVVGTINGVPPFTPYSIASSITQYIIIGAALVIVFLFLMATKVFTPKRVLGLSTAMFIASLPAELVFYRLTGFRGVGLLAGTGLVFVVLNAFLTPILALLVSSVPPFVAFITANNLLGNVMTGNEIAGAVITESISLLAGIAYVAYFEVAGRKFSGISPTWLLRSFLKTWFTGNPSSLEEAFSKIGKEEDVKVKALFILREGAEPIALIYPSIHYGPFRNVGSSRFIYHLESYLEPRLKTFIFHTAGSHEHNLTSSKDSEELARLINIAFDNVYEEFAHLKMCEPYRVKTDDGWEAFVLSGSTFLAMNIVNKALGNDDLPHTLWHELENHPKAPQVVAVADSHSFKGPKITDVSVLKPLIEEVFRRYSCTEGEEFEAGYGEAVASSMCRSVCNPRVKAMTLNFNGRRYALVYIYGNNMDGEYRLKLENLVKGLGVHDVEIVTPDDHSCAASFKEAPYDVVNECEPLTQAVLEAVKESMQNERPAYYGTYEAVFKGVKVVSDKIFVFIDQLATLGKKAEKGLLVLLAVINAAPITLLLTLFA